MINSTDLQNVLKAYHNKIIEDNFLKVPYYTLGEPSTLIGGDYRSEGYFGEVQASNFIYGWEVLAQLADMDMTQITSKSAFITAFVSTFGSDIKYQFSGGSYSELNVTDNLEVEWLKFICDGNLMFIPKRPLLSKITWNEINSLLTNVSVGKDIVVDLNRINPNYSTSMGMSRYVTLKCRLLTGGNHQPFIIGNVNDMNKTGTQLGRGSEWNRLMYRICSQIPTDVGVGEYEDWSGGKQIGDNWANIDMSELGMGSEDDRGRCTVCQEFCRYAGGTEILSIQRGGGNETGSVEVIGAAGFSQRATSSGFRPALLLQLF